MSQKTTFEELSSSLCRWQTGLPIEREDLQLAATIRIARAIEKLDTTLHLLFFDKLSETDARIVATNNADDARGRELDRMYAANKEIVRIRIAALVAKFGKIPSRLRSGLISWIWVHKDDVVGVVPEHIARPGCKLDLAFLAWSRQTQPEAPIVENADVGGATSS